MTTLLIQTEQIPMTGNFLLIVQMTSKQFHEFCLADRDLRIERLAPMMNPGFG
jgi:hypothetical protein